jgi:hypothetical protein
MGSSHGLSSVHSAHEPAGTFNVQRSTFNGKPSTINLPVPTINLATINLATINRFMGSTHGLPSVHHALEPESRRS